jgi:hypothetical protein
MPKGIGLYLSKTYIDSILCFIPSYQSDREIAESMPKSIPLFAIFRKKRNPRLHRKFFAILRMVVANSSKWQTIKQLLIAIKFELNLVDLVQCFDGSIKPYPRSIAFDEMDDLEFENCVYKPSIPLLSKETGIPEDVLELNYGGFL